MLAFPPEAESVRKGRRFASRALSDPKWDPTRETAVLLVSELVTNAIVHGASPIEVAIAFETDSVIVSVRDADTGPLLVRPPPSELGEGGRGILLVDRLADAWGTEHENGRKTVWFRIRLDLSMPGRARTAVYEPPDPVNGADVPTGESPESAPAPIAAERRLATLVIRPELLRALSPREQLAETLDRIVTALDANGAEVALNNSDEPAIRRGDLSGPSHGRALTLANQNLGQLTLYSGSGFGQEEDAFLSVAAERLAVLSASHALVRTNQGRQAEVDFLAEATELLAGATSVPYTLSLAVQLVVPRLAEWCVAYTVDERDGLQRVTAAHVNEERLDSLFAFVDDDLELRNALTTASERGQPLPLPATLTVLGRRYYVVVLPLTSRRRTRGLLVLAMTVALEPGPYLAVLEFGRRVSLALDNARLYEQLDATATALTASLLPADLPRHPHLLLGARYRSASPTLAVGGDFYDAFALDDGTIVLAMGDVCGKGAAAAAVTRTSRDLLRVLVTDGWPLAAALRRLNRALLDDPTGERFCTVALARVDCGQEVGQVSLCLAGHPEPVLLNASGRTQLVGRPGIVLGILPDTALSLSETELSLEPGDSLVFYTDGVTEARDGASMFGQEGLERVLHGLGRADPQRIADAVENAAATYSSDNLRDDLAVLVAQLV